MFPEDDVHEVLGCIQITLSRLGLIMILCIVCNQVNAARNSVSTYFSLEQEHQDNYRVSSEAEESLIGTVVATGFDYSRSEASSTLSSQIDMSARRYSLEEYDSEAGAISLHGNWQRQRGSFGFSVSGNRQSTLLSEFDDTGAIENTASNKDFANLSTNGQWYINQRNVIYGSVAKQGIFYESKRYADTDIESLQLGWQASWSQTVTGRLALSLTRYSLVQDIDAQLNGYVENGEIICPQHSIFSLFSGCTPDQFTSVEYITDVASQALQFGIDWSVGYNKVLKVLIGPNMQSTEQSFAANNIDRPFLDPVFKGPPVKGEDKTGYIGSINYSIKGHRTDWLVDLSRQEQPSGDGRVSVENKVFYRATHRVSELTHLALNLSYAERDSSITKNQTTPVNRARDRVTLSFASRLMKFWTLGLELGYQSQNINHSRESSENFYGSLSIAYRPQQKVW